jgi:hypothetical protein
VPTTFRQDIAAGLVTLLDGFKTANPTLLGYTFLVRPTHFNRDLPTGYVGARPESATHSQGIRTRTMSGLSITFVDDPGDSMENAARMDILVDAFADYLTARPHVIPGTVWNTWTVLDGYEVIGETTYLPNVTFTLPDLSIAEGRV